MNAETRGPRLVARAIIIVLVALVLQGLSPADAGTRAPKWFPKAAFVGGEPVLDEAKGRGVLLHAGWMDDEGNHRKWFRRATLFPWPKPVTVPASAFRIRLTGVTYPGKLEVGVFRRTGLDESPAGPRTIYTCPAPADADDPCRWIPNIVDGRLVWDVEIDHVQIRGHLYVVAVGTWEDPRDPPHPAGSREQIGTWIFHARLAR